MGHNIFHPNDAGVYDVNVVPKLFVKFFVINLIIEHKWEIAHVKDI